MPRPTFRFEGGDEPPLQFVLATANPDKIVEMRHALDGLGVEILTRDDFPHIPAIIEDGATLEQNALKKARTVCAATGIRAIADDTGLEVPALGGAPGVHSSRYGGPGATYADNVAKLLRALEGAPAAERAARFRCVIAMVEPIGAELVVEGICEGVITTEARGKGGFGYDPVFLIPSLGKTFAELTLAEKDEISHRGQAMAHMRRLIRERFLLGES
jgi:XTP/dITP diphosphohydrolase